MSIAQELGKLEFGFWKGTRNYYDEHLASEAVAVYPEPVGALSREEILASIDDGARWQEIELEDMSVIEAAPGMVMLTYRAKASRDDGETYQALVGSVYVKEDGEWRLAFNQQTPA